MNQERTEKNFIREVIVLVILVVMFVVFFIFSGPAEIRRLEKNQLDQKETLKQLKSVIETIPIPTAAKITKVPEPLVILDKEHLNDIQDIKLREFAEKNAEFGRDKVLYFKWQGDSSDEISASLVCDVYTNEHKYIMTLKSKESIGDPMENQQVFVVLSKYNHEMEVFK